MKKPKIRFIPYEGFAVKKSSGEFLDDDVTAEAYEEMIDALIDLTKEYKELVDSGDCGFWVNLMFHMKSRCCVAA